ncbi:MAG: efflux RND transporter periplasmic adaptor subunit [Muribaculaceae bacterium]|nr:efflux RND transporter periplasmic adaptor subunit [Muribaculaceae bacterium]
MKTNILYVGTALAIFAMVSTGCKKEQQQTQQIPELAVMTVTSSDATLNTAYPCTLQGENDVEIRPQATGFLTKVYVKEGQHVSQGQVLFEIDKVQLQAAVDQAKAAVAVAQANVNTAQTNANNNKLLLDKGIIGAPAYQTSVDALNSAKAQLNQSNANLISAQKALSYSIVKSPVAGMVGTIDNKEGTLVSPSTLLTVISNNTKMEALFSITEKELLALTDGGKRSVEAARSSMPQVQLQLADGSIYEYPGTIISISGVLDQSTGSASVRASFPNPEGMLRSGNTGQILIPTVSDGALQIPQSATFEIQDMKFCYVVGDSAKVHSTPITVSDLSDGKSYIVTSGLKEGDKVVIEGVGISVQDGMVIKPKN